MGKVSNKILQAYCKWCIKILPQSHFLALT